MAKRNRGRTKKPAVRNYSWGVLMRCDCLFCRQVVVSRRTKNRLRVLAVVAGLAPAAQGASPSTGAPLRDNGSTSRILPGARSPGASERY